MSLRLCLMFEGKAAMSRDRLMDLGVSDSFMKEKQLFPIAYHFAKPGKMRTPWIDHTTVVVWSPQRGGIDVMVLSALHQYLEVLLYTI